MSEANKDGKEPNLAVRDAAVAVGGFSQLAERLGVAEATVYQWASGDRPVPVLRAIEMDRITQGVVRCETILPRVAPLFDYLRSARRRKPSATQRAA